MKKYLFIFRSHSIENRDYVVSEIYLTILVNPFLLGSYVKFFN
jgi:hypothetical protein